MANTLELNVNQSTQDSSNIVSEISAYTISKSFTEKQVGTISVASGTTYTQIAFAEIPTASFIRVKTDKALTAWVVNGATSSPISLSTDLIASGTFTGLWVNNASGSVATIEYDIRG